MELRIVHYFNTSNVTIQQYEAFRMHYIDGHFNTSNVTIQQQQFKAKKGTKTNFNTSNVTIQRYGFRNVFIVVLFQYI